MFASSLASMACLCAATAPAVGANDDFSLLPVGGDTQDWFVREVDGLCGNPSDQRSGTAVADFRCADPVKAFSSTRAMLDGPHGLARRCAATKQEFDQSVPEALVEPLLRECDSEKTGLDWSICAQRKVYSKLKSDPALAGIVASMDEDERFLLLRSEASLARWFDAEVRNSLVTRICMQAGGIAESNGKGELVIRVKPDHPVEDCRVDPFYDVPVTWTEDSARGPLPPERLSRMRDRFLHSMPGGVSESSCPDFARPYEMCGMEQLLARARTLSDASREPAPFGQPPPPIDEGVMDHVIQDSVKDFLEDYRRHYEEELHTLAGLLASELAALGPDGAAASGEPAKSFAQESSCFLSSEARNVSVKPPSPAAMKEWLAGLRSGAEAVARDSATLEFLDGEFTRNDGKCTFVRDRVDPDPERRRRCEQMGVARVEVEGRLGGLRETLPILFQSAEGEPLWQVLSHAADASLDATRVKQAIEGQRSELLRLVERHCEDPEKSTRTALGYEQLARSYLAKPGNESRGFPFCAVYSQELQNDEFRASGVFLAQLGIGLATGPFGALTVSASSFGLAAWDAHHRWERSEDRTGAYLTGMGSYAAFQAAEDERSGIVIGLGIAAVTSLPALQELSLVPSRIGQAGERVLVAVGERSPETAAILKLRTALKDEGVAFSYTRAGGRGNAIRITADPKGHPLNRYAALLEKDGYTLVYDPNLPTRARALGIVDSRQKVMVLTPAEESLFPRSGKGLLTRVHEHLHVRVNRSLEQGGGTFLGSSVTVLEGRPLGSSYGSYFRLDELNSFGWETEALARALPSDLKGVAPARFLPTQPSQAVDEIAIKAASVKELAAREVDIVREAREALSSPTFPVEAVQRTGKHWEVIADLSFEGRVVRMKIPIPEAELGGDVRALALRQLDSMEAYAGSVLSKNDAMMVAVYRANLLGPRQRAAGWEALRKVFGVAQKVPGEAGFRDWSKAEWLADFDQEMQLQLQALKRAGRSASSP